MVIGSKADAWQETCFITISSEGGADREFAALTETVDFDLGEKDIEGVALTNGGRITKWSPESDTSITFEAYPLLPGTETGTIGTGFFDMLHQNDADGTMPLSISNIQRNGVTANNKYRILVMWTNDGAVSSAKNTTTTLASAMRFGFANVHFTSIKPSFTDGILKFTIVAKVVPFDTVASSNIIYEGTDGTALKILPAITAYTSSNKFG